jgi:antitoxin component YwqK of YwqJK toxin-antitoxin module
MNFQISKAYFKWDFQSWFKSGAKGSVFQYSKGKLEGIQTTYYENSK